MQGTRGRACKQNRKARAVFKGPDSCCKLKKVIVVSLRGVSAD